MNELVHILCTRFFWKLLFGAVLVTAGVFVIDNFLLQRMAWMVGCVFLAHGLCDMLETL